MNLNGKAVMIIVAALMLAPMMAFAEAPQDPAKGGPPTPVMGAKVERPANPLADVQAFKDEMKRHEDAVKAIREPLKAIHEKMAADIKALREQYFPKPAEGEKRVKPDPEKMQEFMGKVREDVAKYQTDNDATLKDVAGKLFDERILHQTNMLKIEADNKDTLVNARYKNLLVPRKMFQRMRVMFARLHNAAGPSNVPAPTPAPAP